MSENNEQHSCFVFELLHNIALKDSSRKFSPMD